MAWSHVEGTFIKTVLLDVGVRKRKGSRFLEVKSGAFTELGT